MSRPAEPMKNVTPAALPHVSIEMVAAVAVGGALGAAGRYGLTLLWPPAPAGFPWATLITNLLGSALLGALMQTITLRIAQHRLLRPFLGTGVLGGFTTFSTYAMETTGLLTAGRYGLAIGYVLGTVAGALGAAWLGARVVHAAHLRWRR